MGNKKGGRQNERPDRQLEVTSPKQWKKTGELGDLVELPSGNVVRSRRPGMTGFIELGMVPNSLLPFVDQHLAEFKPPKMEDIVGDETRLQEAAAFTDEVFLYCVTDPEVLPVPTDAEAEREEDALYLDEVDLEDRLFIFQFAVGGTRSVQRFRQLQVADLATLAAEQLVDLSPEPAAQSG